MKRILYGAILVMVVLAINYYRDDLIGVYRLYEFKKNFVQTDNNAYSKKFTYKYVITDEDMAFRQRHDIINTVYTLLNSGSDTISRYCHYYYKECMKDVESIAGDNSLLSHINDFVHPYNSFKAITFSIDDVFVSMESNKIYSNAQILKIDAKVKDIIKNYIKPTMNNRERIKVIHDYIIEHAKYDTLKTMDINDNTYQSSTAYGVLFEGFGTCSGYSDAMAIFLNELGIINYKISNEEHIWNLVYLDGQWLHLDLTWDDPITYNGVDLLRYDYFLITSLQLSTLDDSDHKFDRSIYVEA